MTQQHKPLALGVQPSLFPRDHVRVELTVCFGRGDTHCSTGIEIRDLVTDEVLALEVRHELASHVILGTTPLIWREALSALRATFEPF